MTKRREGTAEDVKVRERGQKKKEIYEKRFLRQREKRSKEKERQPNSMTWRTSEKKRRNGSGR